MWWLASAPIPAPRTKPLTSISSFSRRNKIEVLGLVHQFSRLGSGGRLLGPSFPPRTAQVSILSFLISPAA